MISSRRNKKAKPLEWPMYGSMAEMAAQLGIPLPVLKEAKKKGCAFVRHGRCDPQEFIKWDWQQRIESGDGSDDKIWGNELNRVRVDREKIKLEQDRKNSVDFAEVTRFINALVGNVFFGSLEELKSRGPAMFKGQSEIKIFEELSQFERNTKQALLAKAEEWKKKGAL